MKGINGSTGGYHTNIGGRVYTKLWLPEEEKLTLPYLCVPLMEPAAELTWDEDDIVRDAWTVRVFGFVAETASSEVEGQAALAAAALRDDIVRAFIADTTLGGTVDVGRLLGWDIDAGVDNEVPYGYVEVAFRLEQHQDGPTLTA